MDVKVDKHFPVLLTKILDFLVLDPGDLVIDATFGRGGYTKEFLNRGAKVLALDRDLEAINSNVLNDPKLLLKHAKFSDLKQIWRENYPELKPKAIVFDLGFSSPQIAQASRGFSFYQDGPLLMTMGLNDLDAAKVVNTYEARNLERIFSDYSDESMARKLSLLIVERRKRKPFTTTKDLADFIAQHKKNSKHHPATKIFQAIRMEVNQELQELLQALNSAWEILANEGLLMVVTFHSTEDRLVKFWARDKKIAMLTDSPVVPDRQELRLNVRSRSAKLRVYKFK